MSRRRTGNPLVSWCETCMCHSPHCTCGRWGTARIPGADAGGHMTRKLDAAPARTLEPAEPAGGFWFETIEEYRQAKAEPVEPPGEVQGW